MASGNDSVNPSDWCIRPFFPFTCASVASEIEYGIWVGPYIYVVPKRVPPNEPTNRGSGVKKDTRVCSRSCDAETQQKRASVNSLVLSCIILHMTDVLWRANNSGEEKILMQFRVSLRTEDRQGFRRRETLSFSRYTGSVIACCIQHPLHPRIRLHSRRGKSMQRIVSRNWRARGDENVLPRLFHL